jgi:hypothetical protein
MQNSSMTWKPATVEEVKAIVAEESRHFDAEQAAIYERCRVEPVLAKLFRYDQWESVVIVARNDDRVIYWEDIDEGFNESSAIGDRILEHRCNQDMLGVALNRWIEGRSSTSCGIPEQ